jgi:hypothetical protein
MKVYYVLLSVFVLFCTSCNSQKKEESKSVRIGQKNITDEIAGSNYRKKATQYFIINEGDTSTFRPIFSEARDGQQVNIYLRAHRLDKKTLKEQLQELKQILPAAEKEYNLDSLRSFYGGSFIDMGEHAIRVTNGYINKHGQKRGIPTKHYTEISNMLVKSVSEELNNAFKSNNIVVKKASIEKAHYVPKEYFLKRNKTKIDTANIPNEIINAMLWVTLGTAEK